MLKIVNFVLFHLFWIAAVGGAGEGWLWAGPLVAALVVAAHLKMLPVGRQRTRELWYILLIGLAGTLADSVMKALGVTVYPTSEAQWAYAIVPPWIASLWIAFATMPRFSLAWLQGRPVLAIAFGAVGGPLSYFFGTRFGAVAVGESALWTYGMLALEYAICMPLMLRWLPPADESDLSRVSDVSDGPGGHYALAELSPAPVPSDSVPR